MIIMAMDDERIALAALRKAIEASVPGAELHMFSTPEEAMEFVSANPCDVAFLDIMMGSYNGVEIAKKIKLLNPSINIIFASGNSDFYGDAFGMHASGYILKPITPQKVKAELDNLRFPVVPKSTSSKLRIQTFGNFEAYVNEKPVNFKYGKTKELLAYLIDRGTMCSNGEIIAALWEGEAGSKDSYLRKLCKDLEDTLSKLGCGNSIIREWGTIGIDKNKIDCDYYNWKNGVASGINAYRGEYMSQYSWSEFTHGLIEWN